MKINRRRKLRKRKKINDVVIGIDDREIMIITLMKRCNKKIIQNKKKINGMEISQHDEKIMKKKTEKRMIKNVVTGIDKESESKIRHRKEDSGDNS